MDKITVVVPCFNEEAVIPTFYKEIKSIGKQLADRAEIKLLFVDDGSRDSTAELLDALCCADSSVGYLSFSRNFGKEAALLAGLRAADGDFVAVMDADMQDPPEYLLEMYRRLNDDPSLDCVAARRTSRAGEPPLRSFFARRFYKLINRFSETEITDGARDFRLMRREMADAVISLGESCRFSKGLFSWVGFNTGWIEFENTCRAAGDTKWSFLGLFGYALEGIMAFTTAPLCLPFIAAVIGGLLTLTTAILAAALSLTETWRAFFALCSVICLTFTLTMSAVGVLGGYTAKLYREVKARPLYIVKHSRACDCNAASPRDGEPTGSPKAN